jgi:hypothetical protein
LPDAHHSCSFLCSKPEPRTAANPDSRKLMNFAVYYPNQAEALPRVSYGDRYEGALAFFGAE